MSDHHKKKYGHKLNIQTRARFSLKRQEKENNRREKKNRWNANCAPEMAMPGHFRLLFRFVRHTHNFWYLWVRLFKRTLQVGRRCEKSKKEKKEKNWKEQKQKESNPAIKYTRLFCLFRSLSPHIVHQCFYNKNANLFLINDFPIFAIRKSGFSFDRPLYVSDGLSVDWTVVLQRSVA